MAGRRLKRQLNLPQVLMLGTAGTIAAEIFVLTGHAAGMSGPASVLVLVLVGLLSSAFALNYAELATTYPVTGGALTYVREAYGNGLRTFLVGSLDSLSSAFYAALSAVGFAYSLRIFLPFVPIIPTAMVAVLAFTVLNLFGVGRVGRVQVLLGGILLTLLGVYIIAALVQPQGFSWERFMPEGEFFVHDRVGSNLSMMLATMALIFNAYVGFELIADDAEEVSNPSRNIPIALLGSLAVITAIYTLIALVTLGTIPWPELAGSETALTQAAARFLPGLGPVLIGVAGIIATLTSINTAMLSGTREALTLGRLGLWPKAMVRLGRLRTPYVAIVFIGVVVGLMCAVGLVDILSYISSSGYLFVMFWSGLAMIRLHQLYPMVERPFSVPLFPLTAYVQVGTCIVVVAFTAPLALAFGGAVLALLTIIYYLRLPLAGFVAQRKQTSLHVRDRIIVAIANPDTADGLVNLAASLSERVAGTVLELFSVVIRRHSQILRPVGHLQEAPIEWRENELLARLGGNLRQRNIPFYAHVHVADRIAESIVNEVIEHGDVKLLMMGWPGLHPREGLAEHAVTTVLQESPTNIAVFLNRGMPRLTHILVPFGGGIHSRLAMRLATELAEQEEAQVVMLRVYCAAHEEADQEEVEDELMLARETIEAEFGQVPPSIDVKLICAESIPMGIFAELQNQEYQLVIMGAALARSFQTDLFGTLTDRMAESIPCSVLLVSRHEPAAITWARKRVKEVVEPAEEAVHADVPQYLPHRRKE